MSDPDIRLNYHSFLEEIKNDFDPIIKKMREQDFNGWRGQAWKGPAKKLKKTFKSAGALAKIKWAGLPLIGPVIAGIGGYLANMPLWGIIGAAALIILITYWILVRRFVHEMTSIASENFHVGAFKAKKPKEYALWASFRHSGATFNGLYALMTPLLIDSPKTEVSIDQILNYAKGQQDFLQANIDTYKEERTFLLDEIEKNEKYVLYLIDLLKSINTAIYRIANGVMNFSELDFICAYTIYEMKGDKLYRIVDKGTTGSSPEQYEISRENALRYAVVDAAMSSDGDPRYNLSSPGRTIVSYRMNMFNDAVWIWNFHFDDSNDRALSLTLSHDIIDIREVYRLVHAFCLILQKDMMHKKEMTSIGDSYDKTYQI